MARAAGRHAGRSPGPAPLEQLKGLSSGYELGCVYWYEDGAWARASHPGTLDDDGLDCGMSRFTDRADVLCTIADEDHGATSAQDAECLPTHTENRRLTPELLMSMTADPG
ncbi:hypothetical protein ABZ281_18175 [Streptomyces sp. NPDC006265]|uniref:hypothetical protein n=1 Tax=Streptomyces sp. NPDC006265 TaxID=3156740 RepID=UPI0033BF0927